MHEQENTVNGVKETILRRRFANNSSDYGSSLIAAGEWIRKRIDEEADFYVLNIDASEYRTDVYYPKRKNL